ncbi:MAG: hypothetical protein ACLR8P_22705 [Clostridium fessum]
MYKVIIIEDDPMVASINKQYVELTSSFHVEATFKNGIACPAVSAELHG